MLEIGDYVYLKPPEELGEGVFDMYSPENKKLYVNLLGCRLTVIGTYVRDYYDLRRGSQIIPFRVTEERVVRVSSDEIVQIEKEFQSIIF